MAPSPPPGRLAAVNVSFRKGEKKVPVPSVRLVAEHGVEGDAHAGTSGHRQVSLLAGESVARMRAKGLDVGPGAFAENLTVEGIDLVPAHVGRRIRVGDAVLEVTQVGKECHDRCAIYVQAGDCVMPREGIFARVVTGAVVAPGAEVELLPPGEEGDPSPQAEP